MNQRTTDCFKGLWVLDLLKADANPSNQCDYSLYRIFFWVSEPGASDEHTAWTSTPSPWINIPAFMIPYPQQKSRRLDLKETGTLLERTAPYHPYHPHCYQGRLGPFLNTLVLGWACHRIFWLHKYGPSPRYEKIIGLKTNNFVCLTVFFLLWHDIFAFLLWHDIFA